MKLFKNLFLILTLTSVLVSCSKDDDVHVPTNSEKIIGNWELNEFKSSGTTITKVGNEAPTEAIITAKGETFTNTFSKFTHPNTLESTGNYLLKTTTKIGNEEVENQKITKFNTSGSWTIEGEKLTIKQGQEEKVFDIIELSDTVLKLKDLLEETTTIGSTVVTTTLTSNLSFEKK